MDTIDIENRLGITFCDRLELAFTHGQGSRVWDEAGREYLDFTSGWGVTCLGHNHPVITRAITGQAGKIIQNPNAGFTYSPSRAVLLALLETVLPANLARTYFCNSGAEANDAALKLARKITGRTKAISTLGGFHGRTFTTLSVTRGPENSARYVPQQNGTVFVPYGDRDAMAQAIDGDTAAVIIEPIQGEGGVQIAPDGYLAYIQDLCRQHGALFIVDEIQTGFCRTGKFFALEHSETIIEPDFLTLGKGIAGGFPFAAFAVSEAVSQKIEKDDHGGTYCGNPLGCAISHAVVSYLLEHNIADSVNRSGQFLLAKIHALKEKFPGVIREIRGKGLLCAVVFHDQQLTRPVTLACADAGLLVVPTRGGIIRLLPDLLVKDDDIDEAVAILENVMAYF
jgi:acetylornithine/N-succinyldiaminopimelate aminotransferase